MVSQMAAVADFGLSPRTLGLLRGVLAQHAGIERAIVYGSRAKGNFRPGSDIDLTLDAPTLMFSELLRINGELDDLMLPYTIDLSLLKQIDNPSLLSHIERVGKPL
jgi:uncharacterized protein